MPGTRECDIENVREWLAIDENVHRFEVLTDEEIIRIIANEEHENIFSEEKQLMPENLLQYKEEDVLQEAIEIDIPDNVQEVGAATGISLPETLTHDKAYKYLEAILRWAEDQDVEKSLLLSVKETNGHN